MSETQRVPFLEQLADGLVGELRRAILRCSLRFAADEGLSESRELSQTQSGPSRASATLQLVHQFLNVPAFYKANLYVVHTHCPLFSTILLHTFLSITPLLCLSLPKSMKCTWRPISKRLCSPPNCRTRLVCKALLPELATLLAATASAVSSASASAPDESVLVQLALLERLTSWFAALDPRLELAPVACVRLALHSLLRRYLFAYLLAELRGTCTPEAVSSLLLLVTWFLRVLVRYEYTLLFLLL